jgi:hypothetical protein
MRTSEQLHHICSESFPPFSHSALPTASLAPKLAQGFGQMASASTVNACAILRPVNFDHPFFVLRSPLADHLQGSLHVDCTTKQIDAIPHPAAGRLSNASTRSLWMPAEQGLPTLAYDPPVPSNASITAPRCDHPNADLPCANIILTPFSLLTSRSQRLSSIFHAITATIIRPLLLPGSFKERRQGLFQLG